MPSSSPSPQEPQDSGGAGAEAVKPAPRKRSSGASKPPRPAPPPPPPDEVVPRGVRIFVAIVLTVMWAVGITAEILVPGFHLHPLVYITEISLAGAIFGKDFARGFRAAYRPPEENR